MVLGLYAAYKIGKRASRRSRRRYNSSSSDGAELVIALFYLTYLAFKACYYVSLYVIKAIRFTFKVMKIWSLSCQIFITSFKKNLYKEGILKNNYDEDVKRVLQKEIVGTPVVKNSTPVVSFGNPYKALVATVGINPSSKEFLDNKNNILPQDQKRLVDLDSLNKTNLNQLDEKDAEKIIDGCYNYFKTGNHYKWFDQMEEHVLQPTGYSYFDDTACHLDLIQWATDPVWSGIKSKEVQNMLLEQDKEFFIHQINKYNFETVFLNGKTVVEQVEKLGIVKLTEVAEVVNLKTGNISRIKTGKVGQTTFVGWGLNIPAKETTLQMRKALGQWLSQKNYLA